jgi:hypothetical protein
VELAPFIYRFLSAFKCNELLSTQQGRVLTDPSLADDTYWAKPGIQQESLVMKMYVKPLLHISGLILKLCNMEALYPEIMLKVNDLETSAKAAGLTGDAAPILRYQDIKNLPQCPSLNLEFLQNVVIPVLDLYNDFPTGGPLAQRALATHKHLALGAKLEALAAGLVRDAPAIEPMTPPNFTSLTGLMHYPDNVPILESLFQNVGPCYSPKAQTVTRCAVFSSHDPQTNSGVVCMDVLVDGNKQRAVLEMIAVSNQYPAFNNLFTQVVAGLVQQDYAKHAKTPVGNFMFNPKLVDPNMREQLVSRPDFFETNNMSCFEKLDRLEEIQEVNKHF